MLIRYYYLMNPSIYCTESVRRTVLVLPYVEGLIGILLSS
jgi:hypothetical protein